MCEEGNNVINIAPAPRVRDECSVHLVTLTQLAIKAPALAGRMEMIKIEEEKIEEEKIEEEKID
jgi:hypothetical protein